MKILWICGLPMEVQQNALGGLNYGACAAWSWVLGHLPPPADVELHIACPVTKGPWRNQTFCYKGVIFHLVRCLPGRYQTGYLFEPMMFRYLKRFNFDLVHGWGTEAGCANVAQYLAPQKHVVQIQGLVNVYLEHIEPRRGHQFMAWRERRILHRAKAVFVESGYSYGISKPYCGLNTRVCSVDHPLRTEFLSAEYTVCRPNNILFLGTLCDRKGFLDALEAFAATRQKDWALTLIGDGTPEVQRQLNRRVMELNAGGNVLYRPFATCAEIVAEMKNSSIFLLPSKMDTGPTALKEALAMGLWPLCYANSGPQEYVSRFKYGSLAATGNVTELSVLLKQVMTERPWENGERMTTVVENVRHELSAATIWKALQKNYSEIMNAH